MHDVYAMPDGPGASGGPVVSSTGELIGLTVQYAQIKKVWIRKGDLKILKIDLQTFVHAIPLQSIQDYLQNNLPPH